MALLVLLGIAIGATLISIDAGKSSPAQGAGGATAAKPSPQKVAPVAEVEAAQHQAFALLRGPSEAPPAWIRRSMSTSHTGQGLNFDLAQKVAPAGSDHVVWVIPGSGWICLFVELDGGGGSSCDTTQGASADGLDLSLAAPSAAGQPSRIESTVGIVPDGVEAVRFKGNENGPEVATVSENAYFVNGGSSRQALVRGGS
ncbi:MAG: hypothetical protein R2725_04480 [Solirubrobacterales bacterium]